MGVAYQVDSSKQRNINQIDSMSSGKSGTTTAVMLLYFHRKRRRTVRTT